MTTNTPYAPSGKVYNQAINAYQKSQSLSLTPLEIVVEIYKILMENLMSARLCLTEKKIEQMFFHQKKCIKVLSTLASHLDFESAAQQSEFLDRVYKTLIMKLGAILAHKDPVGEMDKIIDFCAPLYKRWQDLAKEERAAMAKKAGGGKPPSGPNAADTPPDRLQSTSA